MRITQQTVVAGHPAIWVRDILRKCHEEFDLATLAYYTRLSTAAAAELVEALQTEGLIEPYDNECRTTLNGGTLRNATARRPTSRATATRQLAELVTRVEQVNADEQWVLWVDQVILFGSMLDETRTHVNDIDVAVEFTRRYHGEEWTRRAELAADAAYEAGRRFPTYFEQITYAETSVKRVVKGRSNKISMTTLDDRVLEGAAQRIIYQRLPA